MNKRADNSVWFVIVLILAILVMTGQGRLLGDTLRSGSNTINQISDKSIADSLSECMDRYSETLTDTDGDGLNDHCDNCPLVEYTPQFTTRDSGIYKVCKETELDKDGDCFPIGCCGNDGKGTFLKHKDKRGGPWCSDKKDEDDGNPKKHPPYRF